MALVDTEGPSSPAVQAIQLIVGLIVLLWVIEVIDSAILDGRLDQHGVLPRSWRGLDGVLWMPVLHGGLGHLVANTLRCWCSGCLLLWRDPVVCWP